MDKLANALRGIPDSKLVEDIVEAMTTNETSFFRDTKPFEMFRNIVLPYMLDSRKMQRRMRIWSAACSSGQEPYSLAINLLEDHFKVSGYNIEIIATDISNEILEQAQKANYSQFEVQRGLPIHMLVKYFDQIADKWQLKDNIRKMVQYKKFNLLDSMAGFGTLDVIFCRNVLIYFDEATKANILERLAAQLAPDGILFLGGAETVLGITNAFKPVPNQRGLYIKSACTHPLESLPVQPATAPQQPLSSGR
jgi:chemotaxis protein methyltransferase CheR